MLRLICIKVALINKSSFLMTLGDIAPIYMGDSSKFPNPKLLKFKSSNKQFEFSNKILIIIISSSDGQLSSDI